MNIKEKNNSFNSSPRDNLLLLITILYAHNKA